MAPTGIVTVRDSGPAFSRNRARKLHRASSRGVKRSTDAPDNTQRSKKRRKSSDPTVGVATEDVDELPWHEVDRPKGSGEFTEEGGMLMLEEVDNVEVTYEEQAGGRKVAKFRVKGKQLNKKGESVISGISHKTAQPSKPRSVQPAAPILGVEQSFDEYLIPEWQLFPLKNQIKRSLHGLGFTKPTEIQSRSIPIALQGRDIIGVAETGSGKTLAYGLPIINQLLVKYAGVIPPEQRTLSALILAPTRELALQVGEHLRAVVEQVNPSISKEGVKEDKKGPRGPPLISIGGIVGGMSNLKQRRIIERGMDIMIATPGRLWDLLGEDDSLAQQVRAIRFLVLDEADRMIETGHFEELHNILRLTRRDSEGDAIDDASNIAFQRAGIEVTAGGGSTSENMQTFVFSATLSRDLQMNLKKRKRGPPRKKGENPPSTLDELLERLDFRDEQPEIIDLTPEQGVSHTLQEAKLECVSAEKDLYLYYFLLRYPGRSLVFVSAIDGIRRIVPMLELLGVNVFPLHSQLQQKQRLKNLERFKAAPDAVLVATDVAARGLDIPAVEHVIHYQIPRTADTYIHRSGRTARAEKPGFSLLLCSPDEKRVQRALLQKLGRATEPPELPVEHEVLDKLKERMALAKKIDDIQHKIKKATHEKNWLQETADALEIELDSEDQGQSSAKVDEKTAAQIGSYKAQLRALLSERVVARGIIAKYITSGPQPVADDLLASSYNDKFVGVNKTTATHDVSNLATGKPRPSGR
ncbi:P-loop containing nucleoside triphosphate hydrolase protein [Dacryopinax primogenitus]|uniref:RNA helicase n=1 Tax=Dacryopinax primogenitus (strain DJM 731) TaxID=1858805 RepID=M5G5S8_DACPD|nr:P-loop containing nucleoside triphosphate hydrolase protein [Dacryopinax primogenitus]EJU05616.1 P-loop containing nucleoside triphosphate hydrolase protein [Dacryopinax primogenitus]